MHAWAAWRPDARPGKLIIWGGRGAVTIQIFLRLEVRPAIFNTKQKLSSFWRKHWHLKKSEDFESPSILDIQRRKHCTFFSWIIFYKQTVFKFRISTPGWLPFHLQDIGLDWALLWEASSPPAPRTSGLCPRRASASPSMPLSSPCTAPSSRTWCPPSPCPPPTSYPSQSQHCPSVSSYIFFHMVLFQTMNHLIL